VGPQRGRVLEVAQRLGQLGPQAGRARVLGGDEREVAVDAAAEVQRLAQVVAGVAWASPMSRVTVVTGVTSKVGRLVIAQLSQTGRGVNAGKPVKSPTTA
jgi:hypothetical protein